MARVATVPRATQERRVRMTYDEFLALGEDVHAEWADGEATIFVPTKPIHEEVVGFLYVLLSLYAKFLGLGRVMAAPVELRLVPGRSSREPDLLFVARDHLDRITDDRVDGPADLVIEVISDDSVTRDRVDKRREYAAAGVPEYWQFDPRPGKQRAEPLRLGPNGEYEAVAPDDAGRLRSEVLAGFWLDPAWLWQRPQPNPVTLLATIAPDAMRSLVLDALGDAPEERGD